MNWLRRFICLVAVVGATYYCTGEIMTIWDWDTNVLKVYDRKGNITAVFITDGKSLGKKIRPENWNKYINKCR